MKTKKNPNLKHTVLNHPNAYPRQAGCQEIDKENRTERDQNENCMHCRMQKQ